MKAAGKFMNPLETFTQFCTDNQIEPVTFRRFIWQSYHSPVQIVSNIYALEWAWRDYVMHKIVPEAQNNNIKWLVSERK